MLMRTDPFRELDRLTQQFLGPDGTLARPSATSDIELNRLERPRPPRPGGRHRLRVVHESRGLASCICMYLVLHKTYSGRYRSATAVATLGSIRTRRRR